MAAPTQSPVLLLSDNIWNLHGEAITHICPGVQPLIYVGDEPLDDAALETVDIAFLSADVWPERIRGISISLMKTPKLQWLQTFSAGVDSPFFVQLMERGVTLSNASGAASSPIAQTAILYMLALSRNMRQWDRNQQQHVWQQHKFDELDGANLAVIGMGSIGKEIARLGAALNMNVEACRRTPSGDESCPTFPLTQLDDVLSRADWVASALPLNSDTERIFNADRFARMKKGARFINVGRGELCDEDALITALQSGHLAGAGLDVFAVEPLPSESPLWDMDNVIVTPHSSGTSGRSGSRAAHIFLSNFEHWVKGEPLTNVVN
jgi:phosphoglycerate dehydrogenase-like enzyme